MSLSSKEAIFVSTSLNALQFSSYKLLDNTSTEYSAGSICCTLKYDINTVHVCEGPIFCVDDIQILLISVIITSKCYFVLIISMSQFSFELISFLLCEWVFDLKKSLTNSTQSVTFGGIADHIPEE